MHVTPLPLKPELQTQLNDPYILVHFASFEQLCRLPMSVLPSAMPSVHSLISNLLCYKKVHE